ncbi:MAG: M20/M25/M40 family metallo-hydrolase [Methanobacteriota archaeon]
MNSMKRLVYTLTVFLLLCSPITLYSVSAGPSFTLPSSPSPEIIEMINQVNESLANSYLTSLVAFGPRYTGTENCTRAGQYLYDTFAALDIPVEFQSWTEKGFTSRNIIGTLRGNDTRSNATFIISGHYDTVVGAPGADDDGSGAAAVVAIASVLRQYSFKYTIRFIAFSGEEVGSYGSYAYARDAYRRGDNIVAVLNLDMIGYANTTEGGNVLRFFYPERSQWIADTAHDIVETYHQYLNMSIEKLPNYIGADHSAFIDYGYDGVWIAHPDGYPYGHSPNDTADHLNFTYYAKATRLALTVLAEYARTPLTLQVILTEPQEGYLYVSGTPLVQTDLGRAWYLGLRGATFLVGKNTARADVISNESIRYVIFCIDGNFQFGWPTTPPYENPILGIHYPLIGKHTLKVMAYTLSGDVATDEMDIHIFMLSSQFKKQRAH